MKRTKLKEMKFTSWVFMAFIILLPILVMLYKFKLLDNDLWYLISEGRYIFKNGVYHVDPLSMHSALDVVVQNWLSAIIFFIIYSLLGSGGIICMIFIINTLFVYLLYKVCMLISDDNKLLSVIITLFIDINLAPFFMVSRPQIISFVFMILMVYLLELYIKEKDTKYLKFIPLISLLWINLHASLWLFVVLIMIPYIIDSFKSSKINLEGYKTKPLVITLIISILVAFINPFGYKALTFIFNSYGNKYMFQYINELQPLAFNNIISINYFVVVLIVMFMYMYFRKGNTRVRYICLFFGTLILGMNTIKAFSHFLVLAIFPLAYLLKDIVPSEIKSNKLKKIGSISLEVLTVIVIGLTVYTCFKQSDKFEYKNSASDAVDAIDLFTNGYPASVFVSFNDGGYLEYRGYKAYIDPRAEVFLKKNNHKSDIYKEYYDFENGKIAIDEFNEKYNFDFIFLKNGDRMYKEESINNYFVVYDDMNNYRVYARNNIVDDDVRELIIEEYEKSK